MVEYGLGLVISVIAAKQLGPTDFGRFSFVTWLCGTLIYLGVHGTSTTAIKFVAESTGRGEIGTARSISGWLARIQWIGTVGMLVVAATLAFAWDHERAETDLLPFLIPIFLAVLTKARYQLLYAVALGHQRFWHVSVATTASVVVYLALAVTLVVRDAGVEAFVYAYAIGACVVIAVVMEILSRRDAIHPARTPVPSDARPRLTNHLWLTSMLALSGIIGARTIETSILSATAPIEVVGFFALAGTLTRGAVDLLVSGLQLVLMPAMAFAAGSDGVGAARRILNVSMRYYFFFGMIIGLAGAFAISSLVYLLYGPAFMPAAHAAQGILVVVGASLLTGAIGAYLTTVDMQRARLSLSLKALAVDAIMSLALIPPFGLSGAVAAFACTRLAFLFLSFRVVRRAMGLELEIRPLLNLALAAAIAAAVAMPFAVLLPVSIGGIAAAVLFFLAFLPFSVVTRSWSSADFSLASTLADRLKIPAPASRWLLALSGRFGFDV